MHELCIQGMPDSDEINLQTKQKHLQGVIMKLDSLHIELHAGLFYSGNKLAWGKLSAEPWLDRYSTSFSNSSSSST